MWRFLDAYVSLNGVRSRNGYSIYSDIFRSDTILWFYRVALCGRIYSILRQKTPKSARASDGPPAAADPRKKSVSVFFD